MNRAQRNFKIGENDTIELVSTGSSLLDLSLCIIRD